MYKMAPMEEVSGGLIKTHHQTISLKTKNCMQFIDLTDQITKIVALSGTRFGFVNVQTKHTTTAIIVNEDEPLLQQDLKELMDRLAPQSGEYQHNDFARRVDIPPDEPANGHSHCKALFLPTSLGVNIIDGQLQLGRWQRIFFIELDDCRERSISVMVLGVGR